MVRYLWIFNDHIETDKSQLSQQDITCDHVEDKRGEIDDDRRDR
jgi:hypothetical protein